MSAGPVLSVVMPAYNELGTIAEIVARVDAVAVAKELIIVDDGSTDGTREWLAELEQGWTPQAHPQTRLRVLLQPQNGGKGRAVRRGIEAAEGQITLIQDADLEYDPAEYPALLAPILSGEAEVVYGSRFAQVPLRVQLSWHTLGNRLLTFASNRLTGLGLTDMETCYKAFRTERLQGFDLREDRFGIEPELTANVAHQGLRLVEVPISYAGRGWDEGKKIGWRDGVEAFQVMVGAWARLRRGGAL